MENLRGMSYLRDGESVQSHSATVTRNGGGIYTFTPRKLTAVEKQENERINSEWLEGFLDVCEQYFSKEAASKGAVAND